MHNVLFFAQNKSGSKPYIEVDFNNLEFASQDAVGQSFNITSNTEWEISIQYNDSNKTGWLSLSQSNGKGNATITVNCSDNEWDEGTRGAVIQVKSVNGSITVPITVLQKELVSTLTVSPASLTFDVSSSSKEIYIVSNASWEASVNVDWITLDKNSGTGNSFLQVTVENNNLNLGSRNGTITVKTTTGTITRTVSVEQEGLVINLIVGGPSGYLDKITIS